MTNFNTTQTSELINIIKNYNIPDLGTLILAYSELRVREHNFDYETIKKLEEIAQSNGEVSFNNLFINYDYNETNEIPFDFEKTISPENLDLQDSENEKAKINSITTIPSNKDGKPKSNQTKK